MTQPYNQMPKQQGQSHSGANDASQIPSAQATAQQKAVSSTDAPNYSYGMRNSGNPAATQTPSAAGYPPQHYAIPSSYQMSTYQQGQHTGHTSYGQYPHQYQPYGTYATQGYVAAQYQQYRGQPVLMQGIPQAQQPQKKRKRGKGFWIGMTIALLAVIAAAILAWQLIFAQSNRSGTLGQLDGKTDAEIQAELDRIVEEGMFNISIASTIQMKAGADPADLRIENVPGNPYLMQVTITRDDTGEQIYESGILEQNYHIQSDTLDVVLPKGSYACTATFHALDSDTEQEVGTAGAQITIDVLS